MIRALLLGSVATIAFAAPAFAQDAAAPSGVGAAAPSDQLQEITVTATRRESSLQSTPISVSAITAEDLAKYNVTRVDQIAARVPNFYLSPGVANSSTVSVSLRGRGDNAGGYGIDEPPVGFYFDDVYQARPAAVNTEFTDIERVEVLRGPQGTLFGRNSMTGAVNVISATPGDEVKGNASASYGNYETVKLRGAISGPIVKDALAASIAGVYSHQGEGYLEQTDGGTIDRRNFWGVRGKLHFYGSDHWDIVLIGSHTHNKNDGYVSAPVNPATLVPLTGSYYTTGSPLDSGGKTVISSVSGTIKGEFDGFTIKSITAYSKLRDRWTVDLTGGILSNAGVWQTGYERASRINQHQISQELQIYGDALDKKLNWIAGFYYFNEDVTQSLKDRQYFKTTDRFVDVPEIYYDADTKSYAGYAQLTYNITSKLQVLAGGRYTHEEKSIDGRVNPTSPYGGNISFNSFTPKVGINYQAMPHLFFYGSVSEGFRSGGYSAGATTVAVAQVPFDPEKVWAYEIGMKSDLFNRHVRFNLTGFRNDFKHLVVNYFIPGTAVIVQANGLDETVYGIEAELSVRPVAGLDIYANGGWQHEYNLDFVPGAQVPAGLKRNAVVPYYSGTTGFRYEFPLAFTSGADSIRFGSDFVFRDHFFANINNLPVTETSTIREINAEVSLISRAGWQITAEGRNLANRAQWKNGVGLAFLGAAGRQPVEPRTYRIEVSYRF